MQLIRCSPTSRLWLSPSPSASQRPLPSRDKALQLGFIFKSKIRKQSGQSFTILLPLASARDSSSPSTSSSDNPLASLGDAAGSFCIIEGPETVQDFAQLQLQEIRDNIKIRRNKIFLLMEEVRRLRIQQRIKSGQHEVTNDDENEMPSFPSFIPFLPSLSTATLRQYYIFCCGLVAAIIFFGGFLAPILELKLGLGGTSYEDFIKSMNLPPQLSEVDPIVASFSGGAVGVISSLMVVEVNNVKQQEHKRCIYCHGTGYLACARCSGSGAIPLKSVSLLGSSNGAIAPTSKRCPNCSGAARVMCPTCLCTGTAMASEHDPRIDPFV
ncbi:hypothetical protein GOP47_0028226 [Adiantum capillus-veneris]|nr:hypothetical protein GOP47_0028226 [Adiantum capillus-veneris]